MALGGYQTSRRFMRRCGRIAFAVVNCSLSGADCFCPISRDSTTADRQGTRLDPSDCITFGKPLNPLGRHHNLLLCDVFASTEAPAFGQTPKAEGTRNWLAPRRVFEGNCSSSAILAKQLTPETLGKVVAIYEDSVFAQGVLWNIDSFDQWGVELGRSS
jgi:glucose-6-phosphate isomerase